MYVSQLSNDMTGCDDILCSTAEDHNWKLFNVTVDLTPSIKLLADPERNLFPRDYHSEPQPIITQFRETILNLMIFINFFQKIFKF